MDRRSRLYACLTWVMCLSSLTSLASHQTVFIIDQVPAKTPHDASIYLACHLDDWYPDIATRKFTKNEQGQWQLLVEHESDTLFYKITRGSWDAVEARENGRARPNRLFVATQPYEEVHLTIDAWEDLSYGSYTVYMFFLLIAALQGVLLAVAINTIRNKNKRANSILTILLVLITISLLGRASTFDPDVFNWQPKLILVPELLLFTYGPIFLIYIHKLLVIPLSWKNIWPHFIPFVLQVLLYVPYLQLDSQTFIFRVLDKELFPYFASTGMVALLYNAAYWWLCRRVIRTYGQQDNLNENQKRYVSFLCSVLTIKVFYLTMWVLVVAIFLTGKLMGTDLLYLSENLIDVLWLLFSFIIFALAYYAVKNPELLREKKRYQDQTMKPTEVQEVLNRLKRLLQEDKVFLRTDLTLESLAHLAHTSPHTLSRVINEHFRQSFTDLINSSRIEEFVLRAAHQPEASFLELAFAVGFSSKPTFNRAFKKAKGCTPREFFKVA